MLIGFIYQMGSHPSYTFKDVDMKANLNYYLKQVKEVHDEESKIIAQWRVIKKLKSQIIN